MVGSVLRKNYPTNFYKVVSRKFHHLLQGETDQISILFTFQGCTCLIIGDTFMFYPFFLGVTALK